MKVQTLRKAISKAEYFLQAARACNDELGEDRYTSIQGTRKSGACRRASMELTRILADLRQNR